MEEISSHGRCWNVKPLSAQFKHQDRRIFNADESGPVIHEASEVRMPTTSPWEASPRCTPSPVDPFVYFDSTSSNSVSYMIYRNHSSTQNANVMQTSLTASESDLGYTSARCAPSEFLELPIDNVCLEGVSLEQHLRNSDINREETMRTFILERFLPAAETVAANHDRSVYSVGNPPLMLKFPPVLHSPPTTKMPEHANYSAMDSSKTVAREHVSCCNHDHENGSVNAEMLSQPCGLFWARLWSAMSCSKDTAHAPAREFVTKESMATQSSSRRRSVLKEELQTKGKTTFVKGTHSGALVQNVEGFSTICSSAQKAPLSMNSGFVRGHNDHLVKNFTHVNSESSINLCVNDHPSSVSHQVPPTVKGCRTYDVITNQSENAVSCINLDTYQTSESNPNISSHVSDNVSRDSKDLVTAAADDDNNDEQLQFHDALSRFDAFYCAQSSNTFSQESKSAKYPDPSLSAQISASDVSKVFQLHPPLANGKEFLTFGTNYEGPGEVVPKDRTKKEIEEMPAAFNFGLFSRHNSRLNSARSSSECSETANGRYRNSYQKNVVDSRKKYLASSSPGWPLGIIKNQLQQTESASYRRATKSQFAKNAVEHWRHDENFPKPLNLQFADKDDGGMKHGKTSNHKKSLSMELLPPPIPPAPVASSWLGKALALKASRPSYLAPLQQQQNMLAAQKEHEFILSLGERKSVIWEDVMKGSQEMC